MKAEHEPCLEKKEDNKSEKRKRIVLPSLREYLNKEIEESRRDYNKWFTGEEVRHDPDAKEMFKHYVDYGGAKDFA
ncbi:MAG: hypothetical protein V1688_01545, partial [bacterium]